MKKLLLILLLFVHTLWSEQTVSLQLPWLHQFQFAGYYVAKEKGFYAQRDLSVQIQDASTKMTPTKAVAKNQAQYGVGRSSLIVDYAKGTPIVMLAAVFQSSPMVLLVRKDSGIKSAKDLKGKRVMLSDDTLQLAEAEAMFRSVGISLKDLVLQPHSYNPESLANRQTDAMISYVSNEPYILKTMGVDSRVIDPKDYGFDFYSDILFTTKMELENHPERVKAFHEASIQGWIWAFDHIEETAQLIYKNYNPQHKSLDALIYEGKKLKELAYCPNHTFGTIDPARLDLIAQSYRIMGVLDTIPHLDQLIYKDESLKLTPQEHQWLNEHRVIRVGIDRNWPPGEFVDSSGKHFGVSASYLKLLEERLGVKFQIDYSRSEWSSVMQALQNKELDMLSCAAITPKRKEWVKFTTPYMKQSMVIVARSNVGYVNGLDDLAGKKVAVVKSYASEEFLKTNHPEITPLLVGTSIEALKKVASGEAYACLEGLNTVSYLIDRDHLKGLKVVGETPYDYELAFAFRNDWGMMASIADKVLASVTAKEYQEIHGQWMTMEPKKEINYFYIWGAAGIALIIFLVISYKNRRLDELVRKRTDDLERLNERLQEEIQSAVEKNRTQEKLLMQQTKMAEIGSMVESIAHQWRQPLNILGLSMTKLNLTVGFNHPESAKIIETAEQQVAYMSQTIDDFRNFFKKDRAQMMYNISTCVGEVEALLGPLLAHKKITLIKHIDPSVEISIYPNELKQVLINIINNAREAIEQSGKKTERIIEVSCEYTNRFCTIKIEDTGGGIPLRILDKIFDPYFTTKFESQGTGIGLYMAKMIIEKHFLGKLSVHNTLRGACFEIRLNHLVPESLIAPEDEESDEASKVYNSDPTPV